MRATLNTPAIESFYHLQRQNLRDAPCQGTACFVARHLNLLWRQQTDLQPERVYCLGRCYAAPVSGTKGVADERPTMAAHTKEVIVLERMVEGGARTLDRYRQCRGYAALEKALWAIGYDVFLSNANAQATRQALQALELVIVQDLFLNATAKEFATIFLPAASSFEKDGTFMNAERRIQRVRKAIAPVGQAKTDWEIVCLVARAMGKGDGFDFHSAEEIWGEVRRLWKGGNGISYERIEPAGLQWPCPSVDHGGTQTLHVDSFSIGKRAALKRITYEATPEIISDEFPLLLTTGRTLYQFNTATMTGRTPNQNLRATDLLDMSGDDARWLQIETGERVRLCSRYGEAVLPVRINTAIKRGELFATFHAPEVFLNHVTSPYRDKLVKAPEYKVTAVRVEKIPT